MTTRFLVEMLLPETNAWVPAFDGRLLDGDPPVASAFETRDEAQEAILAFAAETDHGACVRIVETN